MTPAVGAPLARREGPLKVTGRATYAAEYDVEGLLHAWVVQSPVARGTVRSVDVAGLQAAMPGVIEVLWHGNAPRLQDDDDTELLVLQGPQVSYEGQAVALVIAESAETAREAARTLRVDIAEEQHDSLLSADRSDLYTPEKVNPSFPAVSVIGDADGALAAAEVRLDHTYTTPSLHNNPMEPHATIAIWGDDAVTLYDSNQGPSANADKIGSLFDVDPATVRVVSEHVGGGFGSKGSPRPNIVLATMAAKVTGRPVRLVLTRQSLFSLVGYRTPTIQRIQLGARRDGVLTAITHDVIEQTSQLYQFAEQSAVSTRHMYAADNRRTAHQLARLDMPTPRWMRAPGECPGMYALESAMDELAHELGIDPIELRIRNEPDAEPETGTPFTSRHYVDCLRAGAERFGWDSRDPRPGVRRDGEWLTGTGVAGAMYPVNIMPSKARVTAHANGRFTVALGAVDIGTGARTALAQITADELGVDESVVDVQLGDSSLAHASIAGGSSGTSSWGWAISLACKQLRVDLQRHQGVPPAGGISATGDASDAVSEVDKEGKHAFGAHFAEVRVSTVTGEVRMSRMLGVYAAGRIINPRTARSQFLGGMVMGIGMALHEEGVLDPAFGAYVNHDLAEYHVPVNADITDIEAYWLPEDDDSLNPTRTKGIGEIGIVGVAAAVANAVWHATGVRVRDLPIHLEDLLT